MRRSVFARERERNILAEIAVSQKYRKRAMVIKAHMSLVKLVFSGYEYQESAYFESRLKKVVELC